MMYDEETDSLRPSVVSDPPKEIWLNVGEPEQDCAFGDLGEVTWCENEQFPSDIKYMLHSDHEAALAEERAIWNKWADAVIRDLEMRARLHNDDTIEISQGRLVELDAIRARSNHGN